MTDLLTPGQAAAALGISVDQLAKLTEGGKIAYVNVGLGKRPARRYEPADIAAFKAARRTIECPSTNGPVRKPSRTTSRSQVLDLAAIRARLQNEKRSASRS